MHPRPMMEPPRRWSARQEPTRAEAQGCHLAEKGVRLSRCYSRATRAKESRDAARREDRPRARRTRVILVLSRGIIASGAMASRRTDTSSLEGGTRRCHSSAFQETRTPYDLDRMRIVEGARPDE